MVSKLEGPSRELGSAWTRMWLWLLSDGKCDRNQVIGAPAELTSQDDYELLMLTVIRVVVSFRSRKNFVARATHPGAVVDFEYN
jgi:hypothetical protein